MNCKNRAKSSSLFLIELILAILFFSVASAVCVQIFVKSHLVSQKAQELNLAVSECTGAAEVIVSSPDRATLTKRLATLYSYEEQATCIHVYYDHNLKPCEESLGKYRLTIRLQEESSLVNADILLEKLEETQTIYELQIVHHLQEA